MFCSNCGKQVADGANFCQFCGSQTAHAAQPDNDAGAAVASVPDDAAVAAADPSAAAEQAAPESEAFDDVEKAVRDGYELFDLQRYDESRAIAIRLIRNHDSIAGRVLLSLILHKQGDLEGAVRQMEVVVSQSPHSVGDRARLTALRKALSEQKKIASGQAQAPTVQLPILDKNHIVIGTAMGILAILAVLVAMLFPQLLGQADTRQNVVPQQPAAASPQQGLPQQQQQQPTAPGRLFEGQETNPQLYQPAQRVTAPPRTTSPAPQPQPQAPAGPVSNPAPGTANSAQPRQPVPAPPANTQPTATRPSGSGSVTRQPAPDNQPTYSGAHYQRLADDFKSRGDRQNAVANYRLALQAFQRELRDSSTSNQAQHGINSVNIQLQLLNAE